MMLRIHDLSYTYPKRNEPTLNKINLELHAGEMLLLAGPSGCGKSTLLKLITGILRQQGANGQTGVVRGELYLDGRNALVLPPEEIGLVAGTVYQTPDDQLFAMNVRDEVAFALENQGYLDEVVERSVQEALELVDLAAKKQNSIHALSGGQRQRLALAAVLVTKPKLLILDEPVSQMNPQGAQDFLQLLQRLNKEQGLTILLIEHRVNELARYFQRIAVMQKGSIVYDGPLAELWQQVDALHIKGIREPQNVKLGRLLQLPRLVDNTQCVIKQIQAQYPNLAAVSGREQLVAQHEELLKVEHVAYKYPGAKKNTLHDLSFTLHKGEVVALMGFNGAGKSTLLNILGGLSTNYAGKVLLNNQPLAKQLYALGYLRQEADLMLLADTVQEELLWNNKLLTQDRLQELLVQLGLQDYAGDFPLALSKGQRLRLVLGAILARKPQLLLLDEPTTGQDQESLTAIKRLLQVYVEQGGTVFFCTHDVELAAEIAKRVIVLTEGRILVDAPTHVVLAQREYLQLGGLASPTMLEVAHALHLPVCLTAEEVTGYVHAATLGGQ